MNRIHTEDCQLNVNSYGYNISGIIRRKQTLHVCIETFVRCNNWNCLVCISMCPSIEKYQVTYRPLSHCDIFQLKVDKLFYEIFMKYPDILHGFPNGYFDYQGRFSCTYCKCCMNIHTDSMTLVLSCVVISPVFPIGVINTNHISVNIKTRV